MIECLILVMAPTSKQKTRTFADDFLYGVLGIGDAHAIGLTRFRFRRYLNLEPRLSRQASLGHDD